jgi:hypothetical protein
VSAADVVAAPVQVVPLEAQVLPDYPAVASVEIQAAPGRPAARAPAGISARLASPQPPIQGAPPAPSRGPMIALVCGGLLLFVGAGVVLLIVLLSAKGDKDQVADRKKSDQPKPADKPKPVQPKEPEEKPLVVLPAADQKRVDAALDRGIEYLKKSQNPTDGTWPGARVGCTALPALTLLECGLKKDDPAVARAAAYVRNPPTWTNLNTTYDLALAILFLDRLNDARDRDLIRTLAFRLVAGQTSDGGWSYACRTPTPDEQKQLESVLKGNVRPSPLKLDPVDYTKLGPMGRGALSPIVQNLPVLQTPPQGDALQPGGSDNSNTQFAVLALWAARKHDVPLNRTFAWVVKHFSTSQLPDGGWGYSYRGNPIFPTQSMTCSGLLGMAVGLGINREAKAQDPTLERKVQDAIALLSKNVQNPTGRWQGLPLADLYYLWSVERVAVIYKLPRIGDKQWYPWGAEMLISNQAGDGSWNYHNQAVGTSLAMLFLKRINLARGLETKLGLGN